MESICFEKIEKLDYRSDESYKTLRTNIQFCGKSIKTILFTSCIPNEGKSSVTFNLARSFAQNGKKIILVDADLRKSVLVGRYKAGKIAKGLSHYLSGQNQLDEVILNTNISGMDIIFSGKIPPNPAELLGNKRFEQMLNKLSEDYDYVLVDSPPLGSIIDSAVIAPLCDGTILIIENNAISYRFAQDVKKQLEKTNCHIIGVVLNKVAMGYKHGSIYYNNHYSKYHSKYYGTYDKSEE